MKLSYKDYAIIFVLILVIGLVFHFVQKLTITSTEDADGGTVQVVKKSLF